MVQKARCAASIFARKQFLDVVYRQQHRKLSVVFSFPEQQKRIAIFACKFPHPALTPTKGNSKVDEMLFMRVNE